MPAEANLGIDFDTAVSPRRRVAPARVCVTNVYGYTRDGSAPLLSVNCSSYEVLEQEVRRLQRELDALLARGRDHFAARTPRVDADEDAAATRPHDGPQAEATRAKPQLALQMVVADVMSRALKTVRPNDPLSSVVQIMQREHLRHVLVTDVQGRLEGLVSHRDVFHTRLEQAIGQGRRAYDDALASLTAKHVMRTELETVTPDTTLGDAGALMRENKISCLPVVAGLDLLGILTSEDFLAVLTAD